MATARACDVYGTVRGTDGYTVTVERTDEKGSSYEYQETVDLCPRALARLLRMIDRGLRPPRYRIADET